MEVVVLAIVVLTPWAFGGVDPIFELTLAAGVALLLALWAALAIASGRLTIVRCPVTFILALIFVVGLLQLLPLPPSLVAWISPGTANLRAELYPTQPEQLTVTEAAASAPAWPTISIYPHATRQELFRWLAVLVLFAAVRNEIATSDSLWRLSLVMLISGCVLALFGLTQFFSDRTKVYMAYPTAGHAFGPFINRNHFAAYVNMCIGLGVGLLVWLGPSEADRKRRYMVKPNAPTEQGAELASVFSPFTILHSPPQLWTLVGLAIMFVAVVCSVSRGGVATLLIALFVTTCLRITWPIRIRRLEILLVPALLVFGLFAWLGFKPLETRLGGALRGTEALDTGRLPLWNGLLALVPNFPLLGSGYGTLPYVEPLTRLPTVFNANTIVDHAHNDYLEALVEGGVVRAGLTLLLVGLVFAIGFRALRRYSGRTPGALATGTMVAFLAIALHSGVDFSITTPAVGALTAVIVAQMVSLARSDPTKPAASERGRGVSVPLGPASRPIVALTALCLGGVLVLHAWQAERAYRLKLAAYLVAQKQKPPDLEQAITYLEAAARVAPDDADLQSELGQAYLDLGRSDLERFLDEVQRDDHKHLQTRLLMLVLGAEHPLAAAAPLGAWREVRRPLPARLPPKSREVVLETSVVPSLRHFARARQMCALLPRPHMRFAAHATELVRADKPIEYWKRALILSPSDPDLHYFVGIQYLRDGHAEEAWQSWRRSLELTSKPRNDEQRRKHLERLAAIVTAAAPRTAASNSRQRGEQLLDRVLPDQPDDLVEAARILDPTLAPAGPARPLLDRALQLLGNRLDGLSGEDCFLKAQIHRALGDDEAALKAYKQSLGFVQTRPEWRYQYVELLMAKGRWKDAFVELPALKRQMPNSTQVTDWLNEVNRELQLQ
jgi:O-antigen ligase/tetratricopeptide (TPR) repeat protein